MKTLFFWLLSLRACAAGPGPSEIAIADQTLWPHAIASHAAFDEASRAEILMYLRAYGEPVPLLAPDRNEESLRAWRDRTARLFLRAYQDAARSCPGLGCGFKGKTFDALVAFADSFPRGLGPEFGPWLTMTEKFYKVYVAEQKRLASLFPNPTSEILPIDSSEIFGDRFRDGEFLLTFDDGPTPPGGTSDATADAARAAGAHAFFFSLGDALQKRLAAGPVTALYAGQCVGSHGWEHKSHQKWADWKDSLHRTWSQLQSLFPGTGVPFRPPYGQRTLDVVLEQRSMAHAPVVLWNIDSQDWNDMMPIDRVADRVEKLMLLWRRGIILMHDVHPKAAVALPALAKFADAGGVRWRDCHSDLK